MILSPDSEPQEIEFNFKVGEYFERCTLHVAYWKYVLIKLLLFTTWTFVPTEWLDQVRFRRTEKRDHARLETDSLKCQVALLLQELSPYKIEKFRLRN